MKSAPTPPEIALQNGMTRLAFEDDFDFLNTIDVNDTREPGYKWYVSRPYGRTSSKPEDYKVENSVLTLCSPNNSWTLCTMEWKSQVGYAFHQGVLEFRIRIPNPYRPEGSCGGWPAVWSFPPKKLNDTTSEFVEMDWLEYWGAANWNWTTTFHHMKRDPKQDPAVYYWVENAYNNCSPCFFDKEWHTVTFLWVDGKVEGWIDGVPAIKQTFYDNQLPDPMPYVERGSTKDAFKILNSPDQPATLILGATVDNPMEIDWIRVWQK